MTPTDLCVTDTSLVMKRDLDSMAPATRRLLTRWLWQHDLTPCEVAVGLPIERDDAAGMLHWYEPRPDGSIVRRWRLLGTSFERLWPAPFPAQLLTQPVEVRPEQAAQF